VHSIAFANRDDMTRPFVETSRAGFTLAQDISAIPWWRWRMPWRRLMTEGGSITTLTYLARTRVIPNYNVMGVAKAALEAVVRYLASRPGAQGHSSERISAGPVKTAAARAIPGFSSILDHVAQRAPLRRNTDPREVAMRRSSWPATCRVA